MSAEDHDARCEAEFITEAGRWADCGCAERRADRIARAAEIGLALSATDVSLSGLPSQSLPDGP